MILADKIIQLRKQNGWSQEELAAKMNVSRQAVSKWESAQSVPDLNKLVQMSELFGVTIDSLLKEETEKMTPGLEETAIRRVTLKTATEYLVVFENAAKRIAVGVFLCVIGAACLLGAIGVSELPMSILSGEQAVVIGLVALLVFAAVAASLFVSSGLKLSPLLFLKKESFVLEAAAVTTVEKLRSEFEGRYRKSIIFGVCLCVLSPIPLLIVAVLGQEHLVLFMLCVLLVIVAVACVLFVYADMKWSGMQQPAARG